MNYFYAVVDIILHNQHVNNNNNNSHAFYLVSCYKLISGLLKHFL